MIVSSQAKAAGARRGRAKLRHALAATLVLVAAVHLATAGPAESGAPAEKKAAKAKAEEPPVRSLLPEPRADGPLAAQYCESVREAAAEARYAHQTAALEALSKQVDERLARLEEKGAQLKEWLARRDAFVLKATQQLVGIFGSMRPEAAAEQLVRLEPMTAAAILGKLDARAASAILNDMPPEKSARLTAILADATAKRAEAVRP